MSLYRKESIGRISKSSENLRLSLNGKFGEKIKDVGKNKYSYLEKYSAKTRERIIKLRN